MPGNFGGGFDSGREKVKIIGIIMFTLFVCWFLYEGLGVIFSFQN